MDIGKMVSISDSFIDSDEIVVEVSDGIYFDIRDYVEDMVDECIYYGIYSLIDDSVEGRFL